MKKLILIIIGYISLAIGVIAAIVPMLPSFPFLFLSFLCFTKGSEKITNWFKGTWVYKKNLESYINGEGLSKPARIRLLCTLTVVFGISLYILRNKIAIFSIVLFIYIAHIIYFGFIVKNKK